MGALNALWGGVGGPINARVCRQGEGEVLGKKRR